jgi:hypothetical protein
MSRTTSGDNRCGARATTTPSVASLASWNSSLMNASRKPTAWPTAPSTYVRCWIENRGLPVCAASRSPAHARLSVDSASVGGRALHDRSWCRSWCEFPSHGAARPSGWVARSCVTSGGRRLVGGCIDVVPCSWAVCALLPVSFGPSASRQMAVMSLGIRAGRGRHGRGAVHRPSDQRAASPSQRALLLRSVPESTVRALQNDAAEHPSGKYWVSDRCCRDCSRTRPRAFRNRRPRNPSKTHPPCGPDGRSGTGRAVITGSGGRSVVRARWPTAWRLERHGLFSDAPIRCRPTRCSISAGAAGR